MSSCQDLNKNTINQFCGLVSKDLQCRSESMQRLYTAHRHLVHAVASQDHGPCFCNRRATLDLCMCSSPGPLCVSKGPVPRSLLCLSSRSSSAEFSMQNERCSNATYQKKRERKRAPKKAGMLGCCVLFFGLSLLSSYAAGCSPVLGPGIVPVSFFRPEAECE